MNRADIRAFCEQRKASTGAWPTVRQVSADCGGRTETILAILRQLRTGLADPVDAGALVDEAIEQRDAALRSLVCEIADVLLMTIRRRLEFCIEPARAARWREALQVLRGS